MARAASTAPDSEKYVEWMWQSNPNPCSKSEPAEWTHYSDVESLMIEEVFSNKQHGAVLDDYYIDFKRAVQISHDNKTKEKPVKRFMREGNSRFRETRFKFDPIAPKNSFSGEYGWVSPFIVEVRRHLGLGKDQLPSKDETLVQVLVKKAALGIIAEGRKIGKKRIAEFMANNLMKQKDKGVKEVWKCCAKLYSMEDFLYKKVNEAMRCIGDKEHEQVWRSKIPTLGPFCLLLWDDPFNETMNVNMTLYRGTDLKPEQIAIYEDMAKRPNEYRSFQAFTSCSRNRETAENFGNTLFIMNVLFAFTTSLSPFSEYPKEEEELITPGVSFSVHSVTFDPNTKKHVISLKLMQRFSANHKDQIKNTNNPKAATNECSAIDNATEDHLTITKTKNAFFSDVTHYDISYTVATPNGYATYAPAPYYQFDRDGYQSARSEPKTCTIN